jgi:phosphoribosylformylglycinamidine synthase I
MSVRVLVLRTAGTNCDYETAHAFELAGAESERVHVRALLSGGRKIDDYHILVVPGGFSYGDDLGAGTVLANQLGTRFQDALNRFVESGRQVLGICNGFQVLVRLGLLPGGSEDKEVSLVENVSGLFEDRWVRLRVDTASSPVLDEGDVLEMPVAHKEGRLVVSSAEALERLRARGQIALRYVSVAGESNGGDPGYPDNPNGSVESIAGLQSPCGNVLGMMPHPERHLRALHHPEWTRRRARGELETDGAPGADWRQGDGYRVFARMVDRAQG